MAGDDSLRWVRIRKRTRMRSSRPVCAPREQFWELGAGETLLRTASASQANDQRRSLGTLMMHFACLASLGAKQACAPPSNDYRQVDLWQQASDVGSLCCNLLGAFNLKRSYAD